MKQYDLIWKFKNDFAVVNLNGKCGLVNKKYEEICECKYDMCYDFEDHLAKVRINHEFGYINNKGEEVIPCLYNYLEINAYYQEAANYIVDLLKNEDTQKRFKEKFKSFIEFYDWMLDSVFDKTFISFLNDKYKNKLQKRVYNIYDKYLK